MTQEPPPMSDEVTGAEPAVTDAPVLDAPVVDVDPFEALDLTLESFPRDVVEKLREENAKHRTKYAPYRDVFDGVDEQVRDYLLLDVVKPLISADPGSALEELYDLVERIHGIKGDQPRWAQQIAEIVEEAKPTTIAPPTDDNTPLTLGQWKAIQEQEAEAARTAKAQEEEAAAVEAIYAEAEELGYARTGENADDMAALLYLSTHVTGGDMKKAHELRVERFNKAVEAALEARVEQIRSGAAKWPAVSSTGAAPAPAADAAPKDFGDAKKRALARLEKAFGG